MYIVCKRNISNKLLKYNNLTCHKVGLYPIVVMLLDETNMWAAARGNWRPHNKAKKNALDFNVNGPSMWTWCPIFSNHIWLVVSAPFENISQLGWLFPLYGKIKKCSKPPTRYRCSLTVLTSNPTSHRPIVDPDQVTCGLNLVGLPMGRWLSNPILISTAILWPQNMCKSHIKLWLLGVCLILNPYEIRFISLLLTVKSVKSP